MKKSEWIDAVKRSGYTVVAIGTQRGGMQKYTLLFNNEFIASCVVVVVFEGTPGEAVAVYYRAKAYFTLSDRDAGLKLEAEK